MPRKQVPLLILVAGGDQPFQPQMLKVEGEVFEKIAHPWIITVAINYLPPEMLPVVP